MSKRPTLLCINRSALTLTRYTPKPAGGFFTEQWNITDLPRFDSSTTVETMENVRLGKLDDQPPEAA